MKSVSGPVLTFDFKLLCSLASAAEESNTRPPLKYNLGHFAIEITLLSEGSCFPLVGLIKGRIFTESVSSFVAKLKGARHKVLCLIHLTEVNLLRSAIRSLTVKSDLLLWQRTLPLEEFSHSKFESVSV